LDGAIDQGSHTAAYDSLPRRYADWRTRHRPLQLPVRPHSTGPLLPISAVGMESHDESKNREHPLHD